MKASLLIAGIKRWQLLVGLLVFVILAIILSRTTDDLIRHEPLTRVDVQVSNWLHDHRNPPLTAVMLAVTNVHATIPASLFAALFIIYLLRKGRRRWAATVLLTVGGGGLLNAGLKLVFQRQRPYFEDPILRLTSYSFPSGHTMTATIVYGVLAAYLISNTESTGKRFVIIVLASFMTALVGFTRVYLGAHYLTDVLAAIVEGLVWLFLSLAFVHFLRRGKTK